MHQPAIDIYLQERQSYEVHAKNGNILMRNIVSVWQSSLIDYGTGDAGCSATSVGAMGEALRCTYGVGLVQPK